MGFSGSLVEAIVLRCFSLFTLQAQDRVNEQRAMEKSGNTSQVTRSLYAGSLNPSIGQWRSGVLLGPSRSHMVFFSFPLTYRARIL